MSKLKILHTADNHLGSKCSFLADYAATRTNDFFKAFQNIINTAISNSVNLFVLAGDLFDSPHPPLSLVQSVKSEFTKLKQNGIEIALIAGTHDDLIPSDSVYHDSFWDDFIFLKDPVLQQPHSINIQGIPIHIYGISYNTLNIQNPLPSLKRREGNGLHLGLLHCSIQNSPEWNIMPKDLPCSTEDLFALGLNFIGLGHYHNYRLYENNNAPSGSHPLQLISYCGSSEGKKFHESDERYVNVLTYDSEKLLIEKHPVQIKKMRDVEIDLLSVTDIQHLKNKIQEISGPDILAKITLKGEIDFPLHLEPLEEECRKDFTYLKLVDETDLYQKYPVHNIEQEKTIRGLYVRKIQEKIKSNPELKDVYERALKETLNYFAKDHNAY
ncbi:MAG: metallophosphoesterase [Deltaproteobacteria bacterium]|nr:metallophosphoesterase [Deltaproteobacteria bacterium]